ncbi:MAG: hypothetical protein EP338_08615 [Bacteroidetes bacterium]|nr:MAG: hypothetical protein EP338_08615 [Bacteroidota bacterium]
MLFKAGDSYEHQFLVSEELYSGFIHLFEDRNPLHTNEDFAQGKGFESRVMHGNILNGFLSYFIGECLPTKDVIIHTQEIQYKKPVYLGDQLDFSATVQDYYESVQAVVFKYQFKREGVVLAKGKIQIGLI